MYAFYVLLYKMHTYFCILYKKWYTNLEILYINLKLYAFCKK